MIRRMSGALGALVALVLMTLALGAGTASAHSVPVGSVPADGAQVDQSPQTVSITFNEALQTAFEAMTVVGPDGHLWSKGKPTVQGATISVPVGALGPAGTYTVAARVTSADGHVVGVQRTFTLTKAENGTPGPKPSEANGSGGGAGGVPVWPFIVGGVVVFAGALWFVLRPRKQ
ncbi:copper resistance protein CopC [Rhodococcus sp. D2-41]|nr:copper resistance protein CopC [Rhodococcus sp. D2-41]